MRSGPTVDPVAGIDLNGDGFNTDRPGTLERNSFRIDSFKNLDIALAKTFKFGGAHSVEMRADIFNVFNSENVTPREQRVRRNPAAAGGDVLSADTRRRTRGSSSSRRGIDSEPLGRTSRPLPTGRCRSGRSELQPPSVEG